MSRQRFFQHSLLLVLFLSLGAMGCGHGKPKADDSPSSPSMEDSDLGSSDQGKAYGLHTIHFGFDSSLLDDEAKSVLAKNADTLKSRSSVRLQVEGHCDSRGGIQYNIALGEKRANSVKKYLEDLGVPGARLTTISYGKERPLVTGEDEDSYAKNRRANFVVTTR